MNRRTVLGALGGVGVTGLSGYWVFGEHASHGSTRTISLTSTDDIPDRQELSIAVDVLEDTITSSETARLRVTIKNTGTQRVLSPQEGGLCHLFNRSFGGSDDPPGLWLHTPENAAHIDRDGTRWVADRFQSESRGYPAVGCRPIQYNPGLQRSTVYELWDDYRVDGYLEPGTYRWERDVEIWNDPDTGGHEPPDTTLTWGFELRLERHD